MPGGGSKPGERRGGRVAGTPNKNSSEIKLLAQQFGPQAVAKLAQLSGLVKGYPGAEGEAVRVAAIRELLDRGYGKATQPIAGDPDKAPVRVDFRWADASPADVEEEADQPGQPAVIIAFASGTDPDVA